MRIAYLIEQIAAPRTGADLFATGAAKRMVTVWSLKSQTKISQLRTILDFGGNRLAMLSSTRAIVAAGSWHSGAQGYDANTGRVLWSRKDLKHVQDMCDLSNGKSQLIGIGLEEEFYHIINAETGETTTELSGTRKIYPHPHQDLYLLASNKAVYLSKLQMAPIWKRALRSFSVLDAAFSEKAVAYSESAGSVHCLDYYGESGWVFVPERDRHVLRLSWEPRSKKWLAVDWNYEHGGAKRLLQIDSNGHATPIMEIGECARQAFFGSGRYLITSDSEVISTASCKRVWEFREQPLNPAEKKGTA